MTSPSKSKGNSFERECAKILSDVFEDNFMRNIAGSGAFLGGKNVIRKNQLTEEQIQFARGDISVPVAYKKMCVECKFYKDFPFHHFLINKTIPVLDSWIEQQLDIIDEDSFWFIAFKINRCGSYIVIDETLMNDLTELGNHGVYYYKNRKFIVSEFESFITKYKEEIKEKCR